MIYLFVLTMPTFNKYFFRGKKPFNILNFRWINNELNSVPRIKLLFWLAEESGLTYVNNISGVVLWDLEGGKRNSNIFHILSEKHI